MTSHDRYGRPQLFKPRQAVRAKVLKIDAATGRLSLGLKPSLLGEDDEQGGNASGVA